MAAAYSAGDKCDFETVLDHILEFFQNDSRQIFPVLELVSLSDLKSTNATKHAE